MWFCLGGLVEQRLQWELFTPGPGWNVFVSLVTCIIKLTFGHHTGLIPERNIFFFSHFKMSPDQTRFASGGLCKPGGLVVVV